MMKGYPAGKSNHTCEHIWKNDEMIFIFMQYIS